MFNSHWSLKDNRFMYLTSLFLSKWKLNNKCPLPWYHHSLYTGQRRYILLLYYPEFLELGTGTCKASASSMLREGDWSHAQDSGVSGPMVHNKTIYIPDHAWFDTWSIFGSLATNFQTSEWIMYQIMHDQEYILFCCAPLGRKPRNLGHDSSRPPST